MNNAAGKQPGSYEGGAEMKRAGPPQMQIAQPSAGFEHGRILDDEKGGGIEPDERGEPGQRQREWHRPGGLGDVGRELNELGAAAIGHDERGETAHRRNDGDPARGGGEERGEIAKEVADAGAQADFEERTVK